MPMKESLMLDKESIEHVQDEVTNVLAKDKAITEQRITAVALLVQELMLVYRREF